MKGIGLLTADHTHTHIGPMIILLVYRQGTHATDDQGECHPVIDKVGRTMDPIRYTYLWGRVYVV